MTSAVIAQRTHAAHHTHTNVQTRHGHINTTVKRDPAQYTPQEVQAYLLHRVKDERLSQGWICTRVPVVEWVTYDGWKH